MGLVILLLPVVGCRPPGGQLLVQATNGPYHAEVVAVQRWTGVDAELRISRNGSVVGRAILYRNRDAIQDIEMDLSWLEIQGTNVILQTRGGYRERRSTFAISVPGP